MQGQCAAASCAKKALEGHCLHHLISVLPVQVRRIAVFPDSENELNRGLSTNNSSTKCTLKLARLLGELCLNDECLLILACQPLYFPFLLTGR